MREMRHNDRNPLLFCPAIFLPIELELLETLNRTFDRLRRSGIDEELFDVVSGFEAMSREHLGAAP